ncbi:hypothetical protein ACFVUS_02540 [Nocardia sp. NPDC058058]|uniref:hypothetical protein n=1 Tax=Nocardia sp. NPDC058058 TaxID=3346317 RepID=UPI0036D8C55F
MGAVGVGLFVEMVVLLGLPFELIPLSIIPAALMLLPWLRLRQFGLGVLTGWLTVPFGVVVAPIQAIIGLIGGIRLAGTVAVRRYDVPGAEPEEPRTDAWVAGVLWMPLALMVSLLATWKVSGGLTPVVPSRGELAADGRACLVAGAGFALGGVFAVFGRRPRTFGAARPRGPGIFQRGVASALVGAALLTPGAWHFWCDSFTDEVKRDPRARLLEMGIELPPDYRFTRGRSWCGGFVDLYCHATYRFVAGPERFDSYQELFHPDTDFARGLLPLKTSSCASIEDLWELPCEPGDSVVTGWYGGAAVMVTRSERQTTFAIDW